MSAAEKANLARIRDNQRRSRARRKEYLQELEARLRQCELQGIEASAEIQLAARRVADENKKLRLLLSQHGVADESVDAFLQSTAGPETLMTGVVGGLGNLSSGAVQVLEGLLNTRKQCSANGNTGAPEPISNTTGLRSRDSSAGSIHAVQWDPTYAHQMRPQSDNLHMNGAGKAPQQHQFMPPSTAGRTTSAASNGRAGISVQQQVQQQAQQQVQQQQQQQQQAQAQAQAPQQRSRINSIPSSMSSSASPANTATQQSQPIYDFDTQMALSPTFHPHQRHTSQHNMSTPTQLAQNHAQSQQMASGAHPTQYIPTTTSNMGGTNCLYATDMITTMAGGEPQVVRSELCGMSDCDPHMECEVDNQLVFNVMDRYTGQTIGL